MYNMSNLLLGEEGKTTIEQRIISVVLLTAILMTLVGMIVNVMYGSNVTVDIIFIVIWVCAYILRNKYDWILHISYVILILGVVPYNWFTSAGTGGAMPYYTTVFIAVICITTEGWKRIVLAGSLMIVQFALIYSEYIVTNTENTLMYITVTIHISILAGSIAILLIAYSNTYIDERKRTRAYGKVIEENSIEQLHCMKELEALNVKLKSERHDFTNHIAVIHGLVKSSEYDKTLEYSSQLFNEAESYKSIVSIPYSTIRAMLNYKLRKAQDKSIRIDTEIDLPNGLDLNEYDLGVMIGNIFDNALTALAKVEVVERYIKLTINVESNYLIVQIENPFEGNVKFKNNQYLSTKKDMDNHGYGLNYVKKIVEKNDGVMMISHEDHVFKVNVALLICDNDVVI